MGIREGRMDKTHVGIRGRKPDHSTDGNKRERKEEGGHLPMPMAIPWVEGNDWTPVSSWGRGSGSNGPKCNCRPSPGN